MMKTPERFLHLFGAAWLLILLNGCVFQGSLSTTVTAPTAIRIPSPTSPATISPTIATLPAAASPNAAYPLSGSVVIEEGRCCTGGNDGQTIQIQAAFSAASPFGKVSKMRVIGSRGCASEEKMAMVEWESFAPAKTFPVLVGINWAGFYVSAQFQDEQGNLSPVYCDDIAVEGMPAQPAVQSTDWYSQIQCFSENEVHPGPGETVTSTDITFSWPNKNTLPDGVFYKVSAFGASDQYTSTVATGQTREASITLPVPRERAGDIVWYITLVDANGTFLDHGKCSSFAASLLTVNPPEGIKGVHFLFQP